jgi:hypothetical protein
LERVEELLERVICRECYGWLALGNIKPITTNSEKGKFPQYYLAMSEKSYKLISRLAEKNKVGRAVVVETLLRFASRELYGIRDEESEVKTVYHQNLPKINGVRISGDKVWRENDGYNNIDNNNSSSEEM